MKERKREKKKKRRYKSFETTNNLLVILFRFLFFRTYIYSKIQHDICVSMTTSDNNARATDNSLDLKLLAIGDSGVGKVKSKQVKTKNFRFIQ